MRRVLDEKHSFYALFFVCGDGGYEPSDRLLQLPPLSPAYTDDNLTACECRSCATSHW